MPYGQDDQTQMSSTLASIRAAFASGQPSAALPVLTEEEMARRAKLEALKRMGGQQGPSLDPSKVAMLQKSFFGQ